MKRLLAATAIAALASCATAPTKPSKSMKCTRGTAMQQSVVDPDTGVAISKAEEFRIEYPCDLKDVGRQVKKLGLR